MKYVTPEMQMIVLQEDDIVTASLTSLDGQFGDIVAWDAGIQI